MASTQELSVGADRGFTYSPWHHIQSEPARTLGVKQGLGNRGRLGNLLVIPGVYDWKDRSLDNLQTRLPSSGFNFIDDVLWVTVLIRKHLSAAMRRARAVTFVFENSRGNSQKDIQIVGAKNLEIGNPYSGTLGASRPLCVDISVLPITKNKSQSYFPLAPATA